MEGEAEYITISNFIDRVRSQHARDESIQDAVASCVSATEKKALILDTPLNGEYDETIYDALVAGYNITGMLFGEDIDASCLPSLLRRALPLDLHILVFCELSMSTAEAEEIFLVLQECRIRSFSMPPLDDYSDGVLNVIARYIGDCFVPFLSLDCNSAASRLRVICDGIAQSPLLRLLHLECSPVEREYDERAFELLASAIVRSSSLLALSIDTNASLTLDHVCHELLRTKPIQNLDFVFDKIEDDEMVLFDRDLFFPKNDKDGVTVMLDNGRQCKGLLSADNIPLSLWPHILNKANNWN